MSEWFTKKDFKRSAAVLLEAFMKTRVVVLMIACSIQAPRLWGKKLMRSGRGKNW